MFFYFRIFEFLHFCISAFSILSSLLWFSLLPRIHEFRPSSKKPARQFLKPACGFWYKHRKTGTIIVQFTVYRRLVDSGTNINRQALSQYNLLFTGGLQIQVQTLSNVQTSQNGHFCSTIYSLQMACIFRYKHNQKGSLIVQCKVYSQLVDSGMNITRRITSQNRILTRWITFTRRALQQYNVKFAGGLRYQVQTSPNRYHNSTMYSLKAASRFRYKQNQTGSLIVQC